MLKQLFMKINKINSCFGLLICGLGAGQVVLADEAVQTSINWQRLQLNPQQAQTIQVLESQWNHDYLEIQPSIVGDQRKLAKLLSDPKSDPLEIMALQQSIARKREQLRSTATANYLRKRQVLNETQQQALQDMIRQAVAERQRSVTPGFQTEVMPDHIQILINRVRGMWPGTTTTTSAP